MKSFRIVLGVLCVVLVCNCEDHHHIYQRILENQDISQTTILPDDSDPTITKNSLLSNDTKVFPLSKNSTAAVVPRDASGVLEQKLDALDSSLSNELPQGEGINKTLKDPQRNVNVTSLLRTNNTVTPNVENPLYIGVVTNVSTNGTLAPAIFPNGTSLNGTDIFDGDSEKLHTLIHQREETKNETNVENKNQTGRDTEVTDLLNNTNHEIVDPHQHPMEPQEPAQIPDTFNDDTESVEKGHNTEDELRKHDTLSNLDDQLDPLQQRYLAVILVCSLVAASVICYAALLVWRRYLENRYGSRTMLVNEEEFDDPSDMRHFSI